MSSGAPKLVDLHESWDTDGQHLRVLTVQVDSAGWHLGTAALSSLKGQGLGEVLYD